ncbi:hypothetical protein SAMN02745126_05100 [Enhydrobacter aerosaccus]|uniref:Pyridoxamine 5'-phosphate oxidase N-terminal domain-containing protein n=2 Tax=Enhydrobacter aerosaccus TaxID=225324 RepID=A0A1T4SU59_9HYPH|nr:hypothetical protein SAMN02745126_05100 [Enhydrobacter aerosaccus]
MTLATCADNVPWASDVYFAASGFDLVFFSSLDSRHCRNLAVNPTCAVTVHAPVATWRNIRGLQMEGVAGLAATAGEKASALATYLDKFSFARDLMANPVSTVRTVFRAHAHVFRPARIRYLDNRLGIGARFSIDLADGTPVWPPRQEKPGLAP